jgi:hypothetical protein
MTYTYDIETFTNYFCAVFINKNEKKTFEISFRKNELEEFYRFYNSKNITLAIGFNNVRFDAQVLELILANYHLLKNLSCDEITNSIYGYSQMIIEKSNNKEFLPFMEWKMKVKQLDLYLIYHYNNLNKATSLKWIEFSINYHKVQDIPLHHSKLITTESECDLILNYCINDVSATREFALKSTDIINLRLSQDSQYPYLNLLNKSDSSVGETLFLHLLSEEMKIDKKELRLLRTNRGSMVVKDLILPFIKFETPEFNSVLEFYKNAHSGGLSKSVMYKGISYEYGEGGLHASWENKIFEENEEYAIADFDVSSYYPNLSIQYSFKPEHLGESFMKVYKDIYNERKKYPKGSVENQSFKIILNGSYGKLGDTYSFLYDPKAQLQICINGQLLLTMLAEKLSLIENVTIIQCNTDGVTVMYKRKDEDLITNVVKDWEILTKLELEKAEYSKMIISNVNNYISVYTNGKSKYKGLYEIDKEYHKNCSQRIVPIALKKYFVDKIPVKETILNHLKKPENNGFENKGIFDFLIGKKVKWNQNYVLIKGVSEKPVQEKVIRYFVSNESGNLVKKYSDGRTEAVSKGYNVKLFQNYVKEDYTINYNYYIDECYKIISSFNKNESKHGLQLTMF